jgi:hypothetical protein
MRPGVPISTWAPRDLKAATSWAGSLGGGRGLGRRGCGLAGGQQAGRLVERSGLSGRGVCVGVKLLAKWRGDGKPEVRER